MPSQASGRDSDWQVASIGAGQRPELHLTREAMSCIASAHSLFYFRELFNIASILSSRPEVKDVSHLARFGEPRIETYERVAREIVRNAKDNPPVVWLTQGSPGVLCGVTTALADRCEEAGLRHRVIAGVSSLEMILLELRVPVSQGLQVFDASRLVMWGHVPDPRFSLIVLQLSRSETWLNALNAATRPAGLERLEKLLVDAYGANHTCILITLDNGYLPNSTHRISAGSLAESAHRVSPWTSLYVPAHERALPESGASSSEFFDSGHLERVCISPLSSVLEWAVE